MNTLPAKSEVKQSLEVDKDGQDSDYLLSADQFSQIEAEIDRIDDIISREYVLRWTNLG